MAINFLDGITVDSGAGSAPTIVAAGTRPITLTGGAIGSVAIKGSNGGWATGYLFTGNSGTSRGGFGALGSVDNLTYYYIGDAYNDTTMVVQPNAGSVGIGTTSPSDGDLTIGTPKLHVAVGGTSGTFNLAARFQSTTSDADNTGTSILINSSNDRGLLIKAGRKDGDREVAYFDVVTSIGNTTNMLSMGKYGSAYNVGIGTTTPGAKLHVRDSSASTSTVKISAASNVANYGYLTMTDNTANTARLTLGTTYGYSTNKDTITLFNGNVGIGTTSPISYSGYTTLTVDGASGAVLRLDRTDNTNQFEAAVSSSFTYIKNINSKDLWFGTTNTERMRITSAGNIGIGTTSPTQKLDIAGSAVFSQRLIANSNQYYIKYAVWNSAANYGIGMTNGFTYGALNNDYAMTFCMNNDTDRGFWWGYDGQSKSTGAMSLNMQGKLKVNHSIGLGTANPSATQGRIDASNDIVAYSTSDIRLKDNIKSIDKALDKVNSIQGIEFDWIEKEEVHGNSGHDIGVIAQEIEKVLPDVVTTRENGYKAVKYEKIVPLLIEAIKDLSKQVDGLKRLI